MFLSLVFHNHQPVGQLPWAFEEAWRDAYQPLLDTLERFPSIRAALHYTGPLLDWLVEQRPEFVAQLQRLRDRSQIEILGGAYYEPILAVWPEPDRLAQVTRLSRRVHDLFGINPAGMWLAERVWEPQVAEVIAAAGLDFTLLDATLFEAAGIAEARSHGYYEVGAGTGIHAFPISRKLRELIPWKEPELTLDYLTQAQADGGPDALVVFADDGEKFGAWPGTYKWVYEQGWMERCFELLSRHPDIVTTITPGAYRKAHAPLDQITLPAGSYPEMREWSGGNWIKFLVRYPESRDMYTAACPVSGAARQMPAGPAQSRAYDHALRAQSNDAYWHGVFGGLYLPHLRQAIYAEIASAEVLINGTAPFLRAGVVPASGGLLQNERQKLSFRAAGGHIYAWTSMAARHNFLATLRCHREDYHETESSIPPVDDWYPRAALLDHFFGPATTPEDFATARYPEQGDFVTEPWELEELVGDGDTASIVATRSGGVWVGGEFLPLTVRKQVSLAPGADDAGIFYTFTNPNARRLDVWWGMEWNIVLTGTAPPDRHYHADDHKLQLPLDVPAAFDAVTNPIVADRWLQLWFEWEFETPFALWHVPLFTTSRKEGGDIERIYQQSAFVFHRHLSLEPTSDLSFHFATRVTAKHPL